MGSERISCNLLSAGMLAPDFALPAQLAGLREQPCEAERSLWIAVLESDIHDLALYGNNPHPKAQAICRDVRKWLSGKYESVVEFEQACEIAGLDPGSVRKAIRRVWR